MGFQKPGKGEYSRNGIVFAENLLMACICVPWSYWSLGAVLNFARMSARQIHGQMFGAPVPELSDSLEADVENHCRMLPSSLCCSCSYAHHGLSKELPVVVYSCSVVGNSLAVINLLQIYAKIQLPNTHRFVIQLKTIARAISRSEFCR